MGAVLLAPAIRCDLFRDGQRSGLDLPATSGDSSPRALPFSEGLATTHNIAKLG